MAEYASVGGLPFRVTPEQQAQLSNSLQYQPSTQEIAQEEAGAVADIRSAEDRYGTMGAGALGVASGLTLGMGPGFAAAMGFLNPNDVGALEGSGAYMAGDVAGMIIPSLVTGGEAAGARGLLGTALKMTPAGAMGRLGTAAENLALRVLPGSGSIAKAAIGMAARGATEGALINLGHTIGDSYIQNKPLSAEALWASGADGALAGGLLGGSLGLVGGVGKALTEKLPGAVQGAVKGLSEKHLSSTARRLGMTEEQVIEAQATGTLKEKLQNWRGVLDKDGQGVTYGSGSAAIKESAGRYGGVARGARDGVVETLDSQAPVAVPREERILAALETETHLKFGGRFGEKEARKWLGRIKDELSSVEAKVQREFEVAGPKGEGPVNPGPKPKYLDFRGKGDLNTTTPAGYDLAVKDAQTAYKKALKEWEVKKAAYDAFEAKPAPTSLKSETTSLPSTWKAWVESRDVLEAAIRDGKFPTGIPMEMAKDSLRVIDREIESAMRGAAETLGEKGLAEKFLGAQLDIKYARELEETIGKKAAKELLAHETTFTPRDISVLGGMALVGNPALAAGWAAAKGVGRRINQWAEPALAEAAYQRSIGARAASAEAKATHHIRDSVRNFFRNSTSGARRGYSSNQAYNREKPKSKYDRKSYEDAVSRAEQLISANHQQRVRDLADSLAGQGYGQFSQSLLQANLRAVQYVQMNMPPRRAAGSMGSLRHTPTPHGLDMGEFKFLRVLNGITNPFAVLDKLEDGGVMARDEVRAMKYVYPELHGQVVQAAAEEVMSMKMEGKALPMDKIAHLGVILDAPIDSMLDGSRIRPIQASFIPPEPPQDAPPPAPPMGPGIDPMLQTPMEMMV